MRGQPRPVQHAERHVADSLVGAGDGKRRGLSDARPAGRRLLQLARRVQLRAAQSIRAARPRLLSEAHIPPGGRKPPRTVTATRPVNGEFDSFDDDPYWYKDAVIYEVHVRAFYDSD